MPSARPAPAPVDERHDDADERDQERGAADAAELSEIHLEADFEQQQDHAELGERLQRLAAVHPAEHRRPDDDAGDDLADDRRQSHAVRELGRNLGREQDDEDVEQDPVDVHALLVDVVRRRVGARARFVQAGTRSRGST